ncbi:MAG: carboxypeptidase regulatory-like domain-containing protein [Blastocatellia bacterium]
MKLRLLSLISALSILLPIAQSNAQAPQRDNRPRTASISGRVTVSGAPAANASVMVAEVDPRSRGGWSRAYYGESQQRAFIKVRTDGDGRYRVTGLTEGVYLIRALSKAYVLSKSPSDFELFRSVTLDEGESRDNVDIALVRGGVITGRVIDAEGGPHIGGYMRALSVDENGRPKEELDFDNEWMMRTDDRGVYRIYGLTVGRYILSAGGEEDHSRAKRKHPKTFYPDATDQNQAKIIEVKEGAEVTNIDIRLGVGKNTYEAAGRVVDAETGRPLPQVSVTCIDAPDEENEGRLYGRGATTDDEGGFRVTGLSSGRYELYLESQGFPVPQRSSEHYSEKTRFEVNDSDVSGLEVKAIRGSTISGVIALEGVNDPAVKAKLRQVEIGVSVVGKRESAGDRMAYEGRGHASATVAKDGGFRLSGAPPGMGFFHLRSEFRIKRIERDGAEIKSDFEIRQGEQITGVRIVVSYPNGTIRGQVEIVGGQLPEGWRLRIRAIPVGTTTGNDGYPAFHSGNGHTVADEKGRFVIGNLAAGEHELTLNAVVRVGQYDWKSAPGTSEVKQRVTVSSGAETPVRFTLDPARK